MYRGRIVNKVMHKIELLGRRQTGISKRRFMDVAREDMDILD